MKYLDREGLFFVHIPKCAGTDARRALGKESRFPLRELAADIGVATSELNEARHHHPVLGPIAPTHISLPFLSMYFPRVWALFTGASSFVLVREPRARFISALTQRLMEFKKTGAVRLESEIVQREAADVCAWLDKRDTFCDLEYVHFTPQVNYTHLNGEQRVRQIFPLERTDAMVAWLARDHGLEIGMTQSHTRLQPRKWFAGVQPAVRVLARNGLPGRVREALYPLWKRSGLFEPAASQYNEIAFTPDVEAFIARYYAKDSALHKRALERVSSTPTAG